MFDNLSWGEIFICSGLAVALVGRKDLPVASRKVGSYVGRIVGLLQGARRRMDTSLGSSAELASLQTELRSGLRELDAVRAELAVAASSQGLVGRQLGVGGGLRRSGGVVPPAPSPAAGASTLTGAAAVVTGTPTSDDGAKGGQQQAFQSDDISHPGGSSPRSAPVELAPRSHAVRAVAEEEWERRGIGFRSRAEMGTFGGWAAEASAAAASPGGAPPSVGGGGGGGAALLSDLMRQNLIHDQYDRAVREQDEILRSRASEIRGGREGETAPKEDTHVAGEETAIGGEEKTKKGPK